MVAEFTINSSMFSRSNNQKNEATDTLNNPWNDSKSIEQEYKEYHATFIIGNSNSVIKITQGNKEIRKLKIENTNINELIFLFHKEVDKLINSNRIVSCLTEEKSCAILGKAKGVITEFLNHANTELLVVQVADYYEISVYDILQVLTEYPDFDNQTLLSARGMVRLGLILNCPVAYHVRNLVVGLVEVIGQSSVNDKIIAALENPLFAEYGDRDLARLLEVHHSTVGYHRKKLECKNSENTTDMSDTTNYSDSNENIGVLEILPGGIPPASDDGINITGGFSLQSVTKRQSNKRHSKESEVSEGTEKKRCRTSQEYEELIAQLKEQHARELQQVEQDLRATLPLQINSQEVEDLRAQLEEARETIEKFQAKTEEGKSTEEDNAKLQQRVSDLEQALEFKPQYNPISEKAEKILHQEARKVVGALDVELNLEMLAVNIPESGQKRAFISKLIGMVLDKFGFKNLSLTQIQTMKCVDSLNFDLLSETDLHDLIRKSERALSGKVHVGNTFVA